MPAFTPLASVPPPPPLQASLAFPAVLERLRLPAFDLCKVLESWVRQLPSLPRCGAHRGDAGPTPCMQGGLQGALSKC